MATFNKLQKFVQNISNGVFDLATDQLEIALTDSVPIATNNLLSDITQISYTNLSGRTLTTISSVETAGVYNLLLTNITLTATGTVAQFRYIVIYDATSAGPNLIGWYDFGSEVNLLNGDSFVIDFDGVNGLISLT